MPDQTIESKNESEFVAKFNELTRDFNAILPLLQPHFAVIIGFIRLMTLVLIRIYSLLANRIR